MGRSGISYEQVSEAASALVAAGEIPTYARIRSALGDQGSSSTIGKHLQRWKEQQPDAGTDRSNGLDPALVKALRELEELARVKAARLIEAKEAAHAEALAEQQALAIAAERRAEEEAAESHALGVELAGAEAELRRQASELLAGQRQAELDAAELASLRQRLQDCQTEQRALHRQFDLLREQFEHYQETSALQRADLERSHGVQLAAREQELYELRQSNQTLHLQLRDARCDAEAASNQAARLAAEQVATVAQLAEIQAEALSQRAALAERQQERDRWQILEQERERQSQAQLMELQQLRATLATLQAQHAVLADRWQRAEAALAPDLSPAATPVAGGKGRTTRKQGPARAGTPTPRK